MRLNPRRRRRFVRTTDSNHDSSIFPLDAKRFEVHGPDQLRVADLTCITISGGFAYAALILDAWSRRVVGYAIAAASMRVSTCRRLAGTCSRNTAFSGP